MIGKVKNFNMQENTRSENLSPVDPQDAKALNQACMEELANCKALDIVSVNVGQNSSVTDYMIICTGTSGRHVSAIADRLHRDLSKRGIHGMRISGEREGIWAVVDAGSVIAHILQSEARDRYRLEDLYRCVAAGTDPRELAENDL